MAKRQRNTTLIAAIGGIAVAAVLIISTLLMGRSAQDGTKEAVRSVSLFYLDELAGRREQVVAANLQRRIDDINTAIEMMDENDLSDFGHLKAYQTRMKRLFHLEKFAFVDDNGLIYTSQGTLTNIADYAFDHRTLSEPEISVLGAGNAGKNVVIAVPIDPRTVEDRMFKLCFMEIDMEEMLQGVSMSPDENNTTFCNIYTSDGSALSNTVLGGLASEDNLLEAMERADYSEGYSYEKFVSDFRNGSGGSVSFTYDGVQETLSYIPVDGTDWLLTYLIRESVIAEKFSVISDNIVMRSLIQSGLTVVVLIAVFAFIVMQMRKNAKLTLEKETADAENRVKQDEMERRLSLQEKLLSEEKERTQQDKLITALSSDYWSVYYIEFDKDEGVCYQSHADVDDGVKVGDHFRYLEAFTDYANRYVTEKNREEFLDFIKPENIREGLKTNRVISYRYSVFRHGKESYEMVRFAGVRHPEDREDGIVHAVGACFTDVDEETRLSIAQNEALSNALSAAEQANKAKTVFLSNMSHEIRTPMNAIIGLDNIALNDPDISLKTREYLTKIGDSAEHLLNLINDILDMSRIESGRTALKKEEFSFSKLLEYVNTMISGQCQDKGLDYRCVVKGDIDDSYIGDNVKLRQVLINLLGNSVKFTPEGGRVGLEVERTAQFDGKTTLRFVISDTGVGISEDYLPRIFEAFSQEDSSYTSKYGSTGLGLAITKSIVEMMNGSITVDSEKGVGTTFTVTVTLPDAEKKEAGAGEFKIHPNKMSVLIIDDDPIACEHAKLVLEKIGISSDIALSGEEAVEAVRLRHARRDPYNLILVDWKMPEMDGVETTRRIRSVIGNESAIILLTAYKWDDIMDEAVAAGVDSFVAKPLFAANVLEEFEDALKRKSESDKKQESKTELEGKRILLAEDVAINAEIMKMTLQMRGMITEHAENGRIAVDMFSGAPEGYYDAILMDVRMPEMDGLEATRTIRALERADAKTIPVIALTANAFDEDVQRSLQAGMNAHLSKPVDPGKLFETLENLIKS